MLSSALKKLAQYKTKYKYPVDLLRYNLYSEYTNLKDTDHTLLNKRFLYLSDNLMKDIELQKRIQISYTKIRLAYKMIKPLTKIPFILAIFITGDIAALSAEKDSDIDLWIIVNKNRIWITRFIEWFILTIKGYRRTFFQQKYQDKLCINFYKTGDYLALKEKSIDFAGQFVDAICIYCKDMQTYADLLKANSWVKRYFYEWYNFQMKNLNSLTDRLVTQNISNNILYKSVNKILDSIEYILGFIQLLKATRKIHTKVQIKELTTWNAKLTVVKV